MNGDADRSLVNGAAKASCLKLEKADKERVSEAAAMFLLRADRGFTLRVGNEDCGRGRGCG